MAIHGLFQYCVIRKKVKTFNGFINSLLKLKRKSIVTFIKAFFLLLPQKTV